MPIHTVATIPIIQKIDSNVTQTWYADDAAATGSFSELRVWWKKLTSTGTLYGCNVDPSKTWM